MASSEVNVAIVALVVALIALLISASQLLGQLFGTAEGTRKCSRSVIGHWSTLTTWKWHWSELRFETIFASPELSLGIPFAIVPEHDLRTIDSAFEDSTRYMDRAIKDEKTKSPSWELLGMDDFALKPFRSPMQFEGWIALLSALQDISGNHKAQSIMRRFQDLDNSSWPGIRLRYRSWDAMPTDVIGPIATTTLGDIAVIAHRMGMSWKTFDPDKGLLAAEGCGHSLSSVEIRALGLTLRYLGGHRRRPIGDLAGVTNSKKPRGLGTDRSHIWSCEADMFMFGIFPGDKALNLPNFQVNTDEDIRKLMYDVFQLKDYKDAPDWNLFFPKRAWFGRYEINELRGYVCPVLRPRGSTSNLISFQGYAATIFTFKVSRTCFERFVTQYLETKRSQHLEGLLSHLSPFFVGKPRDMSDLEWLELHHDGHDLTTKYFQRLRAKYEKQNFFWDLLRAHFSKAPLCSWDARQKVRSRKETPRNSDLNVGEQPWRYEQVTMQWDNLQEHYVKFMQDANPIYNDKLEIEEAWITLWFRAICWASCHEHHHYNDMSEPLLPTQWFGSRLPVYLL